MITEPLLQTTRTKLANRGRLTLRQVADGSELDYEWVSSFSQGRIADPGVQKVQRLHDYLITNTDA